MIRLRHILVFIIVAVALAFSLDADAQCAMCKATAESSQQLDEDTKGNGINRGILYILFVPYSLLMVMFGIFFRHRIKGFLRDIGLIR